MSNLDDAAFLSWLKTECGYISPRPVLPGHYAAILPLMYTHAIVLGRIGDRLGYLDRWCYPDLVSAMVALGEWNGEGEPQGWHRHPASGRRREGELEQVWS